MDNIKLTLEKLRKCNIYMMFHTHWDREWYSDANVYQHRAIEFMERIFKVYDPDSGYPAFYMDGQTCLLDDYLKICPKQYKKVKKMVAGGRIQIGPWYVQPEEHEPSAESHIRNLEIGLEKSAEFGDTSDKIGYLCDPVTYIPQMPQILKKFGIETMLHGRGVTRDMGLSPQEMTAIAPDGSEIYLLHLNSSYYMDFGLTYEDFFKLLIDLTGNYLISGSTSGNILLMSGGDQLFPTGKELGFIKRFEKETGICIKPTTLPEYAKLLRETTVPTAHVTTEGPWSQLQDIFSARIPLKRRIKTCERKLERLAEPLVSLAALSGADPQFELMRELWRQNVLNMFHDSIYCAHVDEVTRDIEHRCNMLEDLVDRIGNIACYEITRLLPHLIQYDASITSPHMIFNSSGVKSGGFKEIEIYCDSPSVQSFKDSLGNDIPAQLLSQRSGPSMITERYTVDSQSYDLPVKTWQKYLMLLPDIPPMSPFVISAFPVEQKNEVIHKQKESWQGSNFSLNVDNGKLLLSWGGIEKEICVCIVNDRGDLYVSYPDDKIETVEFFNASWREQGDITQLSLEMKSSMRKVNVYVHLWMSKESPELRFNFETENKDCGFRLDMKIAEVLPDAQHTAYTPYHNVVRNDDITDDPELVWSRGATKDRPHHVRYPLVEFFGVNNDSAGLNFFTPDITNYRVQGNGDIEITLLRSVSDLSTPQFVAGPPVPTPDAELRGRSQFDITLVPIKMTSTEQIQFAWKHNSPLAYFPLKLTERSNVIRPEHSASPQAKDMTFPLLQLDVEDVLITAFRCIKCDDGTDAWVARLVNFGNKQCECCLTTGFDFTEADITDLHHAPLKKLDCRPRQLTLSIATGEITTILFR